MKVRFLTFTVFCLTVMRVLGTPAASAGLDTAEQDAIRAAVRAVAPSVVRIETLGGLQRVDGVRTADGPVSGLIVGSDGFIVSAAVHFVKQPTSILVRLPDGTRKPAEVVATDYSRMLTLLKVRAETVLPVPDFAPEGQVRVGQWAMGIGRVYSIETPSLSVGIISAKRRIWGKALQTDAAAGPANYGGPLIDIHGRVVGLVVPLSPNAEAPTAGLEWYDSGIGFAIPADDLRASVSKLKKGDDLLPGRAGVRLDPKTLYTGEPIVASLHPASPAEEAGIEVNDRITAVDGVAVRRSADVKTLLQPHYAGETVRIDLMRGDERLSFDVPLIDELVPFAHGFLGVLPGRAGNDAPEQEPRGVVIRGVYDDSPASRAGLVAGDRIVEIDGVASTDAAILRAAVGRAGPQGTVLLKWRSRDGNASEAMIPLAALPEDEPAFKGPVDEPSGEQQHAPQNDAKTPTKGLVELQLAEFEHEAWAYIPESEERHAPKGLVLYLHAPNLFDREELLRRWRPLCERYSLIFVMPKARSGGPWQPTDIEYFARLVDAVEADHAIDATRVVLHGYLAGGSVAYLAAAQQRPRFRGVATIDSPVVGRMSENRPEPRLAFFLAYSESPLGRRAAEAIGPLRERHFPVTLLETGEHSRDLTPPELERLVRWIDTLDRI